MRGTGTQLDPYIFETPSDWNTYLSNTTAYYAIDADQDWTGFDYILKNFKGQFDGRGHVIRNFKPGATRWGGLFVVAGPNVVIKNVGLENPDFSLIVNGNSSAGGIVAANYGAGLTIQNCWVKGGIIQAEINNTTTAPTVGGILGSTAGSTYTATILDCYVQGTIVKSRAWKLTSPYNSAYCGGIVGQTSAAITMRRCYFAGTLTVQSAGASVYGQALLTRLGTPVITYSDNFWDNQLTGYIDSYGTGKTTALMKTQSTFTNWDFTNVWQITAGNYPTLKFAPPPQIGSRTINSKVSPIIGKTNRSVKATTKSIIQNVIGRATATLTSGAIGTRTIISKIEPILGRVTVGNHVAVTLKSTVDPLTGKVKTTATYAIDCYVDESTSGVNVLQTIPVEKIIETAVGAINQAMLPSNNQVVPNDMTKIVECWIDGITEGVLSQDGRGQTITVKSYVGQIKTTAAPRYSNIIRVIKSTISPIIGRTNIGKGRIETVKSYIKPLNSKAQRFAQMRIVIVKSIMEDIVANVPIHWKAMATILSKLEPIEGKADRYRSFTASRIIKSILKKIKTDVDIKIPGLGAKVKSDKIGTSDVNVSPIYNQVKVDTTSPNVSIETNQGQVGTTIKYQKVIIRIGDE